MSHSSHSESGQSAPIDLQQVRRLFASPERVRESDFLRREVASRMFERLALVKLVPQRILDAGCGEGADLTGLQKRYPDAQTIGVDASVAMLAVAAERQTSAWSALNRVLSQWLPDRLQGRLWNCRTNPV